MRVANIFKRGMTIRTRESVYGYAFVGIWIVGFALFTLSPLA
jgi:hypothetical protein